MAEQPTDGGPAFPVGGEDAIRWPQGHKNGGQLFEACGMSLRDYFAGQALVGILGASVAGPHSEQEGDTAMLYARDASSLETNGHMPSIAALAYRLADAMLAARKGD